MMACYVKCTMNNSFQEPYGMGSIGILYVRWENGDSDMLHNSSKIIPMASGERI